MAATRALVVALGMMGLGAWLIWFFVGRRALKRIDAMSERQPADHGRRPLRRLPVTGSGDEFDRLSENLNVMLARIGALNEGLRQVSDNIAHDLKTPLTRLRNRAEATLNGAAKTAEYRAALEGTIAESDQLIRTFNALLMIARVEAGFGARQRLGRCRLRPTRPRRRRTLRAGGRGGGREAHRASPQAP